MTDLANRIHLRRRVTVKDLARELGMSVSTVSRAFYPNSVIANDTRRTVLEAAKAIGYTPNPLAQSLITKRTQIVGMVVSDLTNPFYPEVLTILTGELQAAGMNVMLAAANGTDTLDDALRLVLTYSPNLVIILAASLSSRALEECSRVGSPCIFFNRLSGHDQTFGVTCDNVQGGKMAADHLIELGHCELLYVAAYPDSSTNVERRRGFTERALARGLAEPQVIEAGQFNYDAGFAAGAKAKALPRRPTAAFCASDIVAIGFMQGIKEHSGLVVPDDMSVIGFDNIAMAAWPTHQLSTVSQPVEAMITATLQQAKMLTADPDVPPRVQRIAPGALIQRATTKRCTAQ